MKKLTWSEVGALFDELVIQGAVERERRIEELRRLNPFGAEEISSLLSAHDRAEGFIEKRVEKIYASVAPSLVPASPGPTLTVGQRVLHFEILGFLGEGSIAKVYLARDLELERQVALKISRASNGEARALAHFCLDGIVHVYSEHAARLGDESLRLLCMQFVSGPTLAQLGNELRGSGSRTLPQMIDRLAKRDAIFDPNALKWREQLSTLSVPQGIVRMGARLAEILDHAHARGVLHLDIKPANILLDPYGRPHLSDFNVSVHETAAEQGFGGTPYYMAPEQKRLFLSKGDGRKLDGRADVFALGVVIGDLLKAAGFTEPVLERILARATAADFENRPSAKVLSEELCSWLRRSQALAELPPLPRGFGWIWNYPMTAFVSLTLFSQVIASVINITYNHLHIVSLLDSAQMEVFLSCVALYNAVTYPLGVAAVIWAIRALFQKSASTEARRRAALRIPCALIIMISVGWLPGAWLFPAIIEYKTGALAADIYWQFAFSFSLAWLVSLTTSLAVGLFVLARALYPRYWRGESQLAADELKWCASVHHSLLFAAALIPMAGILLAVVMEPFGYSLMDQESFKIFLTVLVGFGVANLLLVQRLSQYVDRVFIALKRPRAFD